MTNPTNRRNPYCVGPPNENQLECFFGREAVFSFIENHLKQNAKVILLYGQRRMGKSSVLKQIPKFFAQKEEFKNFVFVNIDLQDKLTSQSLNHILHTIAQEIVNELLAESFLILPKIETLKVNFHILYRDFLTQVYQRLGDKNLVVLIDEFSVMNNNQNTKFAYNDFLSFLKRLIKQQKQLFIISALGRYLEDLSDVCKLFENPAVQEIGLLDTSSAEMLITKPSQNFLEYDRDAIQAILGLSAGHPYFIQSICFVLFRNARWLENQKITRADVFSVIDKAIECAEAGLASLWSELTVPERVVFSAVAQAQAIAISNNQYTPEQSLRLLETKYGVLLTEPLLKVRQQLVTKGFLDNGGVRVKVELVRRWLLKRHPLQDEIRALEKLKAEPDYN